MVLELTAPGGTFQTGQWYYLEVLPVKLSSGFKMVFHKESEFAELTFNNAVTISRGIFGSWENIDKNLTFQPEAVDLGLSVKWASFNLGASEPEDFGDYFAWGETEPKSEFFWDPYKWCNGRRCRPRHQGWYLADAHRCRVDGVERKMYLELEDPGWRSRKVGDCHQWKQHLPSCRWLYVRFLFGRCWQPLRRFFRGSAAEAPSSGSLCVVLCRSPYPVAQVQKEGRHLLRENGSYATQWRRFLLFFRTCAKRGEYLRQGDRGPAPFAHFASQRLQGLTGDRRRRWRRCGPEALPEFE